MEPIYMNKKKLNKLWDNMQKDVEALQKGIEAVTILVPKDENSKIEHDAFHACMALEYFLATFEEEFYNPMSNILEKTEVVIFCLSSDDEDDDSDSGDSDESD